VALLALAFGLMVYAWRRWREARRESAARARAEEALRAREARHRAVVEQTAGGIFLFDAASKRIAEANPAFLQLLGYDEVDCTALTLYDVVAHDRASIDANVAAIAADGHAPIGERDYRRKDGTTIPVEVSATALRGDGGTLFCVVVRDIGTRRGGGGAAGERGPDTGRRRERAGYPLHPRRGGSGHPRGGARSGFAGPHCGGHCGLSAGSDAISLITSNE
jgi:PAS domain S-box-containing protein